MESLSPAGYNQIACFGIGAGSGIAGDPLAALVQPFRLEWDEQAKLMPAEIGLAKSCVNSGRYILAIAWK